MESIKKCDVNGKKVIVRVDFNVPIAMSLLPWFGTITVFIAYQTMQNTFV